MSVHMMAVRNGIARSINFVPTLAKSTTNQLGAPRKWPRLVATMFGV